MRKRKKIMAIKRRTRKQLSEVELTFCNPLKFKNDTPLKIEIVEESKSKKEKSSGRKLPWIIMIIIWILVPFTLISYYFGYSYKFPDLKSYPSLSRSFIKYPKFMALYDEYIVEITLINDGNQSIKNIKAFLLHHDDIPISTTVEGSNSADFGDLNINDRKTREIKLFLKKSTKKKEMKFLIKILADNFTEELIKHEDKIKILCIPYLGICIPYIKIIFSYLFPITLSLLIMPLILYLTKEQLGTFFGSILKTFFGGG
jgi:hypothetical protein